MQPLPVETNNSVTRLLNEFDESHAYQTSLSFLVVCATRTPEKKGVEEIFETAKKTATNPNNRFLISRHHVLFEHGAQAIDLQTCPGGFAIHTMRFF
jgi:hypothetical protein